MLKIRVGIAHNPYGRHFVRSCERSSPYGTLGWETMAFVNVVEELVYGAGPGGILKETKTTVANFETIA